MCFNEMIWKFPFAKKLGFRRFPFDVTSASPTTKCFSTFSFQDEEKGKVVQRIFEDQAAKAQGGLHLLKWLALAVFLKIINL